MYKTAQKHRLSRTEKEKLINDFLNIISSSKVLVIANYGGLNVAQITELRRNLLKYNSKFKVIKNKLFELALNKSDVKELRQFINKSVGIVYSDNEQNIQEILKSIVDYEKQYENFKIIGGYVYNSIVDANKIREISKLPSQKELVAKLIYLCGVPLRRLILTLKNPITSLLFILEKKSVSK